MLALLWVFICRLFLEVYPKETCITTLWALRVSSQNVRLQSWASIQKLSSNVDKKETFSLDKSLFPFMPLFSDEALKSNSPNFCWVCLPSQPAISLWQILVSFRVQSLFLTKGLLLTLWWAFLLGEASVLLLGPFFWLEHFYNFQGIQFLPCSQYTCFSSRNVSVLWFRPLSSMHSPVIAMGSVMRTGSKLQTTGPLLGLWERDVTWTGASLEPLPNLAPLCNCHRGGKVRKLTKNN